MNLLDNIPSKKIVLEYHLCMCESGCRWCKNSGLTLGPSKLAIIAGDYREAKFFMLDQCLPPTRCFYVHSPERLRGYRGPVAFTGTWDRRRDSTELYVLAKLAEI